MFNNLKDFVLAGVFLQSCQRISKLEPLLSPTRAHLRAAFVGFAALVGARALEIVVPMFLLSGSIVLLHLRTARLNKGNQSKWRRSAANHNTRLSAEASIANTRQISLHPQSGLRWSWSWQLTPESRWSVRQKRPRSSRRTFLLNFTAVMLIEGLGSGSRRSQLKPA